MQHLNGKMSIADALETKKIQNRTSAVYITSICLVLSHTLIQQHPDVSLCCSVEVGDHVLVPGLSDIHNHSSFCPYGLFSLHRSAGLSP